MQPRLRLSGWRICDDQRAKEAEVAAQEAGTDNGQCARTAFRMHADVALPLLYAARRLWPGCCLGGGRLGQRPNAADGGGRWGQRQHKSLGMPLFDQDQARTQQSSRCALAPCCSPSPQICSYGLTVRILCKQVTKLIKIPFEM